MAKARPSIPREVAAGFGRSTWQPRIGQPGVLSLCRWKCSAMPLMLVLAPHFPRQAAADPRDTRGWATVTIAVITNTGFLSSLVQKPREGYAE